MGVFVFGIALAALGRVLSQKTRPHAMASSTVNVRLGALRSSVAASDVQERATGCPLHRAS
jgi:hypothetical protein